ncbi:MAG: SdpI family protein [Methanoregula sp.]|nr:MAG: SdpI family protein [Methanoregula sp.]
MNVLRFAIVLVLLATAAVTVASYPLLPGTVVSHWNAAGDADGAMPKFWGVSLIPFLMVGLCGLFFLFPRIDPLRINYKKFQRYYEGFILILMLFFFAIQLQIILWGIGIQLSPNLTIPILMGALFIYTGFLIEHAEPNWFIGIRTPWTLSSETVWKKTHARGSLLFRIAGVVSCSGVLFREYAIMFILVPVILVSAYTVAYSYFEFRNERP